MKVNTLKAKLKDLESNIQQMDNYYLKEFMKVGHCMDKLKCIVKSQASYSLMVNGKLVR